VVPDRVAYLCIRLECSLAYCNSNYYAKVAECSMGVVSLLMELQTFTILGTSEKAIHHAIGSAHLSIFSLNFLRDCFIGVQHF